jgi:CRP/FNR family cyclic AMP-dependent transcriptional regulator
MACDPEVLRHVSLFSLLDADETAVLAGQVELKRFAPRQRIYKAGDPSSQAYIMVSGAVRVTTVDEDQQEVTVDEPAPGEFFGFASMLAETAHQTSAIALEETVCIEVDRHDIAVRANRNPNDIIEEEATFSERIADTVAHFGGSWGFIMTFAVTLIVYTGINTLLGRSSWDPYPFILLNLFLSMLAAVQAPVIMMSQNRQDKKDRLRGELDYAVNRRAESEIQGLARKLNLLGDKMGDLEDMLRNNHH